MSSTALPPGNCGVHGYHGRTACPKCSTSALPFPLLIQSPPVSAAVSPADTPNRYACRWCGWSATNTASWCDLGCGRDYNEMVELPESVVRLLAVGERDKAEIRLLREEIRQREESQIPMIPAGAKRLMDELEAQGERDRRQIAQLTERLTDAQQLLARLESVRHGGGATRPLDGESLEHFACPVCGWPNGGHHGPGRIKGNAENTHEEGCSLYAVLHGEPAPRLVKCSDRPARAVLAGEEDAAAMTYEEASEFTFGALEGDT